MSEVFLDTSYAIALSVASDEHHAKALLLANRLKADGTRLITTRAVVLEIGNALSRRRHRQAAIELLEVLEEDEDVDIIPATEELYQQAFGLYRARPDKEWSIVDCISFVVMQDAGLTAALTSDAHFEQAGFVRLP